MADLDDRSPLSASVAAADPPTAAEKGRTAWARALLAAHPVLEGHAELPPSAGPEELPAAGTAEVGARFWSLLVDPEEGVIGTLRRIDAARSLVAARPESLCLARTTAEIARARRSGRVAAVLGPVGWTALGGSGATLRAYRALGVRAVNLTRFDRFAREAVREMNRVGLAVDLSGADPDTVRRALAATRAPALLTRAAPEDLPDDVLRLLGGNGAVCMVPVAAEPHATADVLDRVRAHAGPHGVGLSRALSPGLGYVPLLAELLRRGWSAPELVGLAHANVTRALRETEYLARGRRARPAAA
ncbi:membrane dipeptidase [Streptomyces sp. NPDC126503]|uniref:membrane dipeptidase n=1 Tax=Streptomyces sp. NPDC126503 TaxID=3155315 RepID=UPI00332D6F97